MAIEESRTPGYKIPISLVYRSIDRKYERDQFCIECGHPFMTITDKVVTVLDAIVPVKHLRNNQTSIGVRCKQHYCKQRYKLEI